MFAVDRSDGNPHCPACGGSLSARAEAHSVLRRGRVAVLVEWRICRCGAMTRSDRLGKIDPVRVRRVAGDHQVVV